MQKNLFSCGRSCSHSNKEMVTVYITAHNIFTCSNYSSKGFAQLTLNEDHSWLFLIVFKQQMSVWHLSVKVIVTNKQHNNVDILLNVMIHLLYPRQENWTALSWIFLDWIKAIKINKKIKTTLNLKDCFHGCARDIQRKESG